ncbi:C-type mannose receptor 2-like [Andrena cerasifolii]|uniref:C-type mannose receptor 2-like n=1 Tax=Andrena cerasifolii TaxID=2819439 RepID=UPI00403797B1
MLKVMKGCVDRVPRDDYAVVPSMGAYKLHKRSRKWNDARKSCMAEGGDGNYLYTTWCSSGSHLGSLVVTMEKLLLTLTLVAFSSGVLCNVARNLTEGDPTAESVLSMAKTQLHNTLYKLKMPCTSGDVRDDYKVVQGMGAYKLNKRVLSWDQARRTCMDEGGQLAVINSHAEGNMLVNWLKEENVHDAWIGIHDMFEHGMWVTLTGETLGAAGYDKWSQGKPNGANGNEHCGNILDSDGMGDRSCDTILYYFCKIYLCFPPDLQLELINFKVDRALKKIFDETSDSAEFYQNFPVTMDKLLLTLTLVAFSSGVLCNVARNLTEGDPTTESVPSIAKTQLHNTLYKLGMPCTSGDVRDDYVVVQGMGAYKLNKRVLSWDQARRTCMDEGGQLAVINSHAEGKMLVNWMKNKSVHEVWIGTHDMFKQGHWVTLLGETVRAAGYDKWSPGEPNNANGNEHCGNFLDSDGMGDRSCDTNLYYFCKIYLC